MRKLMWFAVGFTAGCIPGAYLLWNDWFMPVAAVCSLCATGLFFFRPKAAKIIATVLLGISVSIFWTWGYDALYLSTARQYDGKTVAGDIEISDYSYETTYGIAADGFVSLDGKKFRVRAYMDKMDALTPGDHVQGDFKLRLTTNEGQQEATYHQGKGIFLLAYSRDETVATREAQIPVKYYPAKLRQEIVALLDSVIPMDAAAFAKALLLGDSTDLGYAEDTAFKISGIRHVIAVSGLHVSILFALVYLFSGKKRVLTALFGVPVLVLFAAVAGFTPSIIRACIMQCLMILAMLFKKEYDPPTALSFAVLVMLLANPLTVTSVSFQLSVGCMVGIFLFCTRISQYLQRLLRCPSGMSLRARLTRWFAGSVGVTLSAMSVTTPLSALYFGTVSIIGVLTNLITLWVISFIFYGIMLACVAGALWIPLGKVVGWLIAWPVRYVLVISKFLSSMPMASVYTCSVYVVIWLVFVYLLFALLLLSKRKRVVLTASCVVLSLLLSVFAAWLEPRLDDMRATVIDVGQGQSILLQSGGKHYLVDCGGDDPETAADTVSALLLSQGILRLDGVILTHYDADHAGAVEYLLTRVDTDALYLPDIPDDNGMKNRLTEAFSHCTKWVRKTEKLSGSWGTITMLPGDGVKDENECSLCILFQAQNCDILITGDRDAAGERALLESCSLPQLELLVAGHHGSKSATCFELLSKTQPKAVAISVGEDNRYGHPAEETLDRLEMFGCRVLRTDQQGTIIFRR